MLIPIFSEPNFRYGDSIVSVASLSSIFVLGLRILDFSPVDISLGVLLLLIIVYHVNIAVNSFLKGDGGYSHLNFNEDFSYPMGAYQHNTAIL